MPRGIHRRRAAQPEKGAAPEPSTLGTKAPRSPTKPARADGSADQKGKHPDNAAGSSTSSPFPISRRHAVNPPHETAHRLSNTAAYSIMHGSARSSPGILRPRTAAKAQGPRASAERPLERQKRVGEAHTGGRLAKAKPEANASRDGCVARTRKPRKRRHTTRHGQGEAPPGEWLGHTKFPGAKP